MSRLCRVSLTVAPSLEKLLFIMYMLVSRLFVSIGRLGRGRSSVVQQEVTRASGIGGRIWVATGRLRPLGAEQTPWSTSWIP